MVEPTSFISGILSGAIVVLALVYGYIKKSSVGTSNNGEPDLKTSLDGLSYELGKDSKELVDEVNESLGNVSLFEVGTIIKKATELAEGGYTQGELIELAEMAIKAGRKNLQVPPPEPPE